MLERIRPRGRPKAEVGKLTYETKVIVAGSPVKVCAKPKPKVQKKEPKPK
jgi:hypothetical protein